MKNYFKKIILATIIILLVILNATLLYQNYKLKNGDRISDDVEIKKGGKLLYFALKDVEGNVYTSSSIVSENNYTLFILFTLTDCPSCLMEKNIWEEIHKSKKVSVVGIVFHGDEIELKSWIINSNLSFTILVDKDKKVTELIKNKFNIDATPSKLLVANNGDVIFIQSAQPNPERHHELITRIDNQIQNINYQ